MFYWVKCGLYYLQLSMSKEYLFDLFLHATGYDVLFIGWITLKYSFTSFDCIQTNYLFILFRNMIVTRFTRLLQHLLIFCLSVDYGKLVWHLDPYQEHKETRRLVLSKSLISYIIILQEILACILCIKMSTSLKVK